MDPILIAICICGGLGIFGFILAGLMILNDYLKQHQRTRVQPVNAYWREIYETCKRADKMSIGKEFAPVPGNEGDI